jgi:hypothetical protein
VKVTTQSPPSIHQQQGSARRAIGGVVGDNFARHLAPQTTLSRGLTKDVALMIGIVIDENAQKSKEEYSDTDKCVNGRSVLRQVKGMGRVDRWDPNKTSPANVISGTIVLNVLY